MGTGGAGSGFGNRRTQSRFLGRKTLRNGLGGVGRAHPFLALQSILGQNTFGSNGLEVYRRPADVVGFVLRWIVERIFSPRAKKVVVSRSNRLDQQPQGEKPSKHVQPGLLGPKRGDLTNETRPVALRLPRSEKRQEIKRF